MKKSGVVQLNVRVPEFIAERLRILAALSGETQAELVILALQDYLDKHNDLIRNFLALQQRFAGGRAHSAVKDTESPSQVAGQTAQAEEAQGSVRAEPSQTAQGSELAASAPQADMQPVADGQAEPMRAAKDSEQGHVPQAAPVPSDSEQVASSSLVDMQDGSSMSEQLGQDALQHSSPAGSGPGSQDTAQDSEQDAPTLEAQGLPCTVGNGQDAAHCSGQEEASQEGEPAGTESTGQEADKPGPSVEELRARARELKAQGLNQCQIAREIGKSEASVRRYLKAEA